MLTPTRLKTLSAEPSAKRRLLWLALIFGVVVVVLLGLCLGILLALML